MSVILDHAFGPEGIVMEEALAATDVRFEVERITAPEPTNPRLFIWATGALDAFDAALDEDPTVSDVKTLREEESRRLYSLRTTDAADTVLYPLWTELGGEGLTGRYADGWWHGRIRFPSRADAAAYQEALAEHGVESRLKSIRRDDGEVPGSAVTPEQRAALRAAYRAGYFEVPRTATMQEIAEELGVSTQAVSERLRRGYARLVERELRPEPSG